MTHTTIRPSPTELDRFLAGESAPDEADRVEGWISAEQRRSDSAIAIKSMDIEAASLSLSGRWLEIRPQVVGENAARRTIHAPTAWRQWSIGAAILIVAAGMLRYSLPSKPIQSTTRQYQTSAGQRANVTLPDGSTVVLAPQSRVTITSGFGKSENRTVKLDGQALFTVTHSAGAPFTVQTGDVATRVLGTSFSVRRYPTDARVEIVVAQGRVAVGNAVIATGDMATATNAHDVLVSRGNLVSEHLAWAEGQLVLHGTELRDAIPELERWYGIHIEVTDSHLLTRRISASFDTETVTRAMEVIGFAVNASSKITGNRVVLHSR